MSEKISGTAENWESGALGMSCAHAVRTPEELNKKIDDALGLQVITLRLPKKLVEGFAIIAKRHNLCCQVLMGDALRRFLIDNASIDD